MWFSDCSCYVVVYAVMMSQRHGQNSTSGVTKRDKELPNTMAASQPRGTFYDDSLRPKSFLRDEVDEFNRILAELLESKQRPEHLAGEDDAACWSSRSEDDKVDVFQTTQRDRRRTDVGVVNSDFDIQNVTDIRHASVLDSQPSSTRWTDELTDDEEDQLSVADGCDTLLKIVEEQDCLLTAKSGNVHSFCDVSTDDDLFNEVCLQQDSK